MDLRHIIRTIVKENMASFANVQYDDDEVGEFLEEYIRRHAFDKKYDEGAGKYERWEYFLPIDAEQQFIDAGINKYYYRVERNNSEYGLPYVSIKWEKNFIDHPGLSKLS